MRVLLAEDNRHLAGNICDYFNLKGLLVDYAAHGKQALSLLQDNDYDVIVLDVMMPGQSGFEVCRNLREQQQQTPVIFLTAKAELEHKLEGFEAGGDDYLTKPFELDELLCRIKALTARGLRTDLGTLDYGEISLDAHAETVTRGHTIIKLNHTQFLILKILLRNAPAMVSRSDLEYQLWGEEPPDSDVLRTHIYRIRSLLDKPFAHHYLQTIHGNGYRLVAADSHNTNKSP